MLWLYDPIFLIGLSHQSTYEDGTYNEDGEEYWDKEAPTASVLAEDENYTVMRVGAGGAGVDTETDHEASAFAYHGSGKYCEIATFIVNRRSATVFLK